MNRAIGLLLGVGVACAAAAAGVGPPRPVVRLHYDYMVAEGADPHSHAPNAKTIELVVEAFRRQGIELLIDPVHHAIPERRVTSLYRDFPLQCTGTDFFTIDELRATYFRPPPGETWHYAVFGHSVTCPDAEHCDRCPGDYETGITPDVTALGGSQRPLYYPPRSFGLNFVVSMGVYHDFGVEVPVEAEAATLMHEIGHNFGLMHGGDDPWEFKPNYLSVMNYSFSAIGIPVSTMPGSSVPRWCGEHAHCPARSFCSSQTFGETRSRFCTRVDYSDRKLPDLDERRLSEVDGIGAPHSSTDITIHYAGFKSLLAPSSGPIDWNNDGRIQPGEVAANINLGERFGIPVLYILPGSDDWSYLREFLSSDFYLTLWTIPWERL